MSFLEVSALWELSPMIREPPALSAPSWVQVHRELTEWAVLFSLVREKDYATDTVIVCDGLLRSKGLRGHLVRQTAPGNQRGNPDQLAIS